MINAKTTFEFICPKCKALIKKEADFKTPLGGFSVNSQDEAYKGFDIFWEGQCSECFEYVYDIKL